MEGQEGEKEFTGWFGVIIFWMIYAASFAAALNFEPVFINTIAVYMGCGCIINIAVEIVFKYCFLKSKWRKVAYNTIIVCVFIICLVLLTIALKN